METIKKYLPPLAGSILIFLAGAFVGVCWFAPALTQHHYTEKTTIEKPTIVQGKETVKTETQIAYVPKETVIEKYIDPSTGKEVTTTRPESTDLDAQIGKATFDVRLNGQPIQFTKMDDEKYIFEKNKIALSKITFDARVAPTVIDRTKRWSAGVGYGSHGLAGKVGFPVGRGEHIGGWLYGDKDTKVGGLEVRF